MKTKVVFCTMVLISTVGVFGAKEQGGKHHPVLQKVEQHLHKVLAQLGDEVKIEYSSSSESLLIKYHTRNFMIHRGAKTGKFSEKAKKTVGPDLDGFVLTVHVQDAGVVNQAVTPQTIKEPYWKTDLNVTRVSGTPKQIYWGLSYGARPDRKILSSIRKTLLELGDTVESETTNQICAEKPVPVKQGDELTGLLKRNVKALSEYLLKIDGGQFIGLRGDILKDVPDGTRIWVKGEIHSVFFDNSSDPMPAMGSQWHIFMNVESYEKIARSFERPKSSWGR